MTTPTGSLDEWLTRESAHLRAAREANPGRSILFPPVGAQGTDSIVFRHR